MSKEIESGDILEGEIVDDETTAVPVRQAAAVAVVHVYKGAEGWTQSLWDLLTLGEHRRFMKAAAESGDREAWAAGIDRWEAAKQARHDRLVALPGMVTSLGKVAAGCAVIGLIGLIVISTVVALSGAGRFLDVILGLLELARWIITAVSWAWTPLLISLPFLILFAAWRSGRRRAPEPDLPRWIAPARALDHGSGDEPITPSSLVTALRDIGYAPLRQAIRRMADNGAGMLGPITIAGCGVEVDVLLPSGVSTDEIQKRRRKLAENLHRHEHELHILLARAARTVNLWIADSGALDEPIGPSPLALDDTLTADLYTGRAPWGVDLRGDQVAISLLQRHLLITGLSNQGKTAALRALLLWLALDPTVRIWLADLKGAGDYAMFRSLAEIMVEGPADEHVIAATEMLEKAVEEMGRRLKLLGESGSVDGVTREMARRPEFRPIVVVVDEAQVAFMCPAKDESGATYGGTKATSRYFMAARKIHNQGRAVNVILWQGTQDPTDQNLPKLVREGAHIRASLVVGTEEQARMALGDKAVNGGAAPHKLRQGLDKGVIVVAGDGVKVPAGQASLTIRTHFIDGPTAVRIADRARANRQSPDVPPADDEPRDFLADLLTCLHPGEKRVRTIPMIGRLEHLHREYKGWTARDLSAALAVHGLKVRVHEGQSVIRRDDLETAVIERDTHPEIE